MATEIKYKVYRLQLVDMLKYEIRQNIQIHMTYFIVNKFDPWRIEGGIAILTVEKKWIINEHTNILQWLTTNARFVDISIFQYLIRPCVGILHAYPPIFFNWDVNFMNGIASNGNPKTVGNYIMPILKVNFKVYDVCYDILDPNDILWISILYITYQWFVKIIKCFPVIRCLL